MLSKLLCLVSFSDHRVKSHNKWKVSFWKRSIKHTNEQNRERRSDRTIKWTREGVNEKKTSRERRASEMMDRRLNELRELTYALTHERIGQNTRTDGRTEWWWNIFILRNAQYSTSSWGMRCKEKSFVKNIISEISFFFFVLHRWSLSWLLSSVAYFSLPALPLKTRRVTTTATKNISNV